MPDFLFGPATAPFQVEGGLDDLSDYGLFARVTASPFEEPAGMACDHFHRYERDIHMIAELGFNAYRFGVEWARVEPKCGRFDDAAIAHYARVTRTCREYGLAPVVTLHHFSSPRWLISIGGWEADATPELFCRYSDVIVEALGGLILGSADETPGVICTLNEVNTGALNNRVVLGDVLERVGKAELSQTELSAFTGEMLHLRRSQPWVLDAASQLDVPAERFTPWTLAASPKAFDTIVESHRRAVRSIKERFPDLRVGLTLASQDIRAKDHPDDVRNEQILRATDFVQCFFEDWFLRELGNELPDNGDFVGVQAYIETLVGEAASGRIEILPPAPDARLVQLGYEFAPESLEHCVRRTHMITSLPIAVTEFGIGTVDDTERVEYYATGMAGLNRCIDEGVPVWGFMLWSALDNYEWEYGYGPQFGIVDVDRRTMARSPKPSAHILGEAARRKVFQVRA